MNPYSHLTKGVRTRIGQSIRTRLLFYFVLVAILPAIAISIGSSIFGIMDSRQQTLKQLESLSTIKTMNLSSWISAAQNELIMSLNEAYVLERIQVISRLIRRDTYYEYNKSMAVYRLKRYLADTKLLQDISFLNNEEKILISTNPDQEGKSYPGPWADLDSQQSVLRVLSDAHTDAPSQVVITLPAYNLDAERVGVLMGVIRPETLSTLLDDSLLEENQVSAYLMDTAYTLYDDSPTGPLFTSSPAAAYFNVHSQGIDTALQKQDNGRLIYKNQHGTWVLGVYRWIPELNMTLILEQDMALMLSDVVRTQLVNLFIILCGILLAVAISILISRRIASPLTNLSQAAAKIASGDLQRTVDIQQEDEIGLLADAFNSMTIQLRGLIDNLEKRVKDRTSELQESNRRLVLRALQMETTFKVSREITSILDVDRLLTSIVRLIQEAFGYYDVGIYLLDSDTGRLLWRAGAGPVHPQYPSLAIETPSLNTRAIQEGQPILVSEVNQDAAAPAEIQLPGAYSELAVPLRMGEKIFGTMDVYQSSPQAFSEEDIRVLQGLSDQVAIAINNALLYERIKKLAVLEERNRMARELHDSISQILYSQVLYADASSKYIAAGQPERVVKYIQQLQESAHQALKEMRLMIYELRPSILETEGLWGAIQHRLETVEQRSGLEVVLHGDHSIQISPEIEKELYLITQEVLNNVLKHSRADRVEVTLCADQGRILLNIFDNGIGFAPSSARAGLGLSNIREHAERIGASYSIESTPGQGTRVMICIS